MPGVGGHHSGYSRLLGTYRHQVTCFQYDSDENAKSFPLGDRGNYNHYVILVITKIRILNFISYVLGNITVLNFKNSALIQCLNRNEILYSKIKNFNPQSETIIRGHFCFRTMTCRFYSKWTWRKPKYRLSNAICNSSTAPVFLLVVLHVFTKKDL